MHTGMCIKRFENILADKNDPRIERMLVDLSEAMQDNLEADAMRREPTDNELEGMDEDNMDQSRGSEDVAINAVLGMEEWRERNWEDGVHRMDEELMKYGAGHHVSEIYSPPRVTKWAERMRLAPGMAFDLTQVDPEDGLPWDFNDGIKARKVI